MRVFLSFFLCFFYITNCTSEGGKHELLIVVLNPTSTYHNNRAVELKENIMKQYEDNNELLKPAVRLLHESYAEYMGAWTITPILHKLAADCSSCKAVLFVDHSVAVDLQVLTTECSKLPLNQDFYGGKALKDDSMTIVHHYNFHRDLDFPYSHISSGFLLSRPLLSKLASKIKEKKLPMAFSLDAYYEFSLMVSDLAQTNLTSLASFCGSVDKGGCAVKIQEKLPQCDIFPVALDNLIVAVKTCAKFHASRIPILKQTWGGDVRRLLFVSDKEDPSIPTIYSGTPNTKSGHCKKLMLILKRLHREMQEDERLLWAFVADDDTLLSVSRLVRLLSCHNSTESLYIGERYGYGVSAGYGYDYITLGGGMALSRGGLEALMQVGGCKCPSADAPDDMGLGMCLNNLELPLTHSAHFHQARPVDYCAAHLKDLTPVSFHRHKEHDPLSEYAEWLQDKESRIDKMEL